MENFRAVQMDLTKAEDYARLADESVDTIICLNVPEHIGPDVDVLGHLFRLLQPGGHAIILVPQHPWLYTRPTRLSATSGGTPRPSLPIGSGERASKSCTSRGSTGSGRSGGT
jgi:SAM-dependent methyltransferase